ncbi:hypothetical protein BVG79_00367 [Ketogulonicigenium robustum]|uniref:Uncharacterized protein n=1 Tax=Ketogulonicigenium robustum TaxID=92947 RepID=A0A1W6NX47_9RHOB|nr:hypothetical protein [Ketogulonicigenium robustum]ARO13723.1 hypothetical protein BVG79_00367 [Ketogulonicigenium robustum]
MLLKIMIVFLAGMVLLAMVTAQVMKWMGKQPKLTKTCTACGKPLLARRCDCKRGN